MAEWLLVGLALGFGSVSGFYNINIYYKIHLIFFSVLMSTMEVAQELVIIWKDPHRDWYSSICHKEGSHFYTSQILTLKYRQNLCQEILPSHRKQGKTIFDQYFFPSIECVANIKRERKLTYMMVSVFKRHLYVRSDKLQIVPLSFKRLKTVHQFYCFLQKQNQEKIPHQFQVKTPFNLQVRNI